MLPSLCTENGFEPSGSIPFHNISSHEMLHLVTALREQTPGLLFLEEASNGDHLEPFLVWRIPFRSGTIILMRGYFSGHVDVDFCNYNDVMAMSFIRQLTAAAKAAFQFNQEPAPSPEKRRTLATCDHLGCPAGKVNWN